MIYTIKKGNHRSVWFPRMTFNKSIHFCFRFLTDIPKTDYTNKVYGLIDGIFPHKNSVRLGFRRKKDKMQICSIIYNSGVRRILVLKEVGLKETVFAHILKDKYHYFIFVNGDKFVFDRTSKFNLFSFRLFPYWGGEEKARQDIKIEINEI